MTNLTIQQMIEKNVTNGRGFNNNLGDTQTFDYLTGTNSELDLQARLAQMQGETHVADQYRELKRDLKILDSNRGTSTLVDVQTPYDVEDAVQVANYFTLKGKVEHNESERRQIYLGEPSRSIQLIILGDDLRKLGMEREVTTPQQIQTALEISKYFRHKGAQMERNYQYLRHAKIDSLNRFYTSINFNPDIQSFIDFRKPFSSKKIIKNEFNEKIIFDNFNIISYIPKEYEKKNKK